MEKLVYHAKRLTLVPCLASLLGFLVMLVLGTVSLIQACHMLMEVFSSGFAYQSSKNLISLAVFALDQYLISFVFLIFSAGLYSLFLATDTNYLKHIPVLQVSSLDELKAMLGKAVILALLVEFFKFAIEIEYTTGLDLLYLAGGIMALSIALFLLFGRVYCKQK